MDGSFRGNLGEVFVRCNNVGHDPIWIDFEEMKIAVNGWMCWYYTVDSALLVVTQMVCSASPQVQSSILADSRIQILFLEMFRLLCKRLPVDSFLPLLAGTLYPRYGRWGIWHGLSEWGRKAGLPVAEFWWILELFTGRIYDKQFAV